MVSNESFKVKIEKYNPYSKEYKDFWRFIKKNMIEGYWVSGKFMPPTLFFYINLWHIELMKMNKDGTMSNNRTIGKPYLRDIEWEKGYIYLEAKGFSGFELDEEFHCIDVNNKKENVIIPENKIYVPAREYLRRNHGKNLGKPLYQNNCKNVFDLEARGLGKSYWASGMVAHNYLTDGITDYDKYLIDKDEENYKSNTFVGAIDESYVTKLCDKVKVGLDFLEGGQQIGSRFIPSPLAKVSSGSLKKQLINYQEVQVNGVRKTIGTGSTIEAKTFGGSEFKASGGRVGLAIIDEVGFMFNLQNILGTLRDNTINEYDKFGVVWMTGTGGEMDAKAISGVKEVFYNPSSFECLEFDDIYENKGKCGFFLPKYMGVNTYKDSEGNTNIEEAKAKWNEEYEKKLKTKNQNVIDKFLINQPAVPSHAFMTKVGAKFTCTKLIENQLERILTNNDLKNLGSKGFLRELNGEVIFENEVALGKKLYEVPFPYNRDKDDAEGCVLIFEHPKNKEVGYKYIASLDPIAHDVGDSLPSFLIYKRSTFDDLESDRIVAEYTGRKLSTTATYEQGRLLLMYYNAVCLSENQNIGFKEHLQNKNGLSYLAFTPNTFSSTVTQARKYGMNKTVEITLELENYVNEWLIEVNPSGGINLDYIFNINLLKELLAYDGEKNCDRVDSLLFLIGFRRHLIRKIVKEQKEDSFYNFMNKKHFLSREEHNKLYFS